MADNEKGHGRARLEEILMNGLADRRPSVPVVPRRLAVQARRHMSEEAWAYIAGSAGRESTARANRQAFDHWRVLPRMLSGITQRDLSLELFGQRLPAPILLAPIGVLEMVHSGADREVAEAAAAEGVPMIFSSQASVPMEECAAVMGDSPRWFQLYWGTSDEVAQSFVRRAEDCGCNAVVLTLDTTVLGWRPRDLDLASLPFLRGQGLAQYTSDPVFLKALGEPMERGMKPPRVGTSAISTLISQKRKYPGTLGEKLSGLPRAAVQRFFQTFSRLDLVWSDIARLKEMTDLPVLVKGVQAAADARLAVDNGADGIVVSNHGGRQVDGAVGSLDVLPGIVETVDGAVPVLFDSGIRCGADIFKALALGATAVCVGRPYVYGLTLGGAEGTGEVIRNLVAELDNMMALCGVGSLADLNQDFLLPAP